MFASMGSHIISAVGVPYYPLYRKLWLNLRILGKIFSSTVALLNDHNFHSSISISQLHDVLSFIGRKSYNNMRLGIPYTKDWQSSSLVFHTFFHPHFFPC